MTPHGSIKRKGDAPSKNINISVTLTIVSYDTTLRHFMNELVTPKTDKRHEEMNLVKQCV